MAASAALTNGGTEKSTSSMTSRITSACHCLPMKQRGARASNIRDNRATSRIPGTWYPLGLSPHAIPATPEGPGCPGSGGGHPSTGLPPRTTESTPSLSYRGYTWVRCTLRPAGLRAHLGERSSGNSVLPVTRGTSLKLPGRAARSRGRTSTGESQSIHGILSGTFFLVEPLAAGGEAADLAHVAFVPFLAPSAVSRYFCLLLRGLSGIVISIRPASRAGWR